MVPIQIRLQVVRDAMIALPSIKCYLESDQAASWSNLSERKNKRTLFVVFIISQM